MASTAAWASLPCLPATIAPPARRQRHHLNHFRRFDLVKPLGNHDASVEFAGLVDNKKRGPGVQPWTLATVTIRFRAGSGMGRHHVLMVGVRNDR